MLLPHGGKRPRVDPDAWIHESAHVIGDVTIGPGSSIWFGAVVRGDVDRIHIGARTNVQDHCVIHVTSGRWPTILGDDVTIGHRAVLHGCTIGNLCLVGIGAIVLDGAEIADEVLVGAGSVVTPGTKLPSGVLVLGSPARAVRELREPERRHLRASAGSYVGYARRYREQGL